MKEISIPAARLLRILRDALGEAVVPANCELVTVIIAGGYPSLSIKLVVADIAVETEKGRLPA